MFLRTTKNRNPFSKDQTYFFFVFFLFWRIKNYFQKQLSNRPIYFFLKPMK